MNITEPAADKPKGINQRGFTASRINALWSFPVERKRKTATAAAQNANTSTAPAAMSLIRLMRGFCSFEYRSQRLSKAVFTSSKAKTEPTVIRSTHHSVMLKSPKYGL